MANREQLRAHFLDEHGYKNVIVDPLDQDASTRCYFRLRNTDFPLILMDAPPATENTGQFIEVTKILSQLDARVPTLHGYDTENGFVLLEDLGNATFTHLLRSEANEHALYQTATDALINFQRASIKSTLLAKLPDYDLTLCLQEAILFCDWYLPAVLGRLLNEDEKSEFTGVISTLFNRIPPADTVLVHRDFHVDNLLLVENECAFLDYQDAVTGSATYDLMSLLEDARRDIDPNVKQKIWQHWLKQHNLNAENADFAFRFWGAQRHCKVAGIFVRLWLRDHKPVYLGHLNRVLCLLAKSVHNDEMQPLADWLSNYLTPIHHGAFASDESNLRNLLGIETSHPG